MSGIGDNDAGSLLFFTFVTVPSPHKEQPDKFALSAGSALKGASVHPANFTKHPFKFLQQTQNPLNRFLILKGMQKGKAGQSRNLFVDFWVVFHGAGAERVEMCVNTVVELRKPNKMPDDGQLVNFGQRRWLGSDVFPPK